MSDLISNVAQNQIPGTSGVPEITPIGVSFTNVAFNIQLTNNNALQINYAFPKEFTVLTSGLINIVDGQSETYMENSATPYIQIKDANTSMFIKYQDQTIDLEYAPGVSGTTSYYLYLKDNGTATTYTFAVINYGSLLKTFNGTLTTTISSDAVNAYLMKSQAGFYQQTYLCQG